MERGEGFHVSVEIKAEGTKELEEDGMVQFAWRKDQNLKYFD